MYYGSRCYWKRVFSILFSRRRKVYVMCHPTHPNLGDQAQLMCTDRWIASNYPGRMIVHLGYFKPTLNLVNGYRDLLTEFSYRITLAVLKATMRKDDLLLGHSGYFMVDHHNGWKMFVDMMRYFPRNKMVIFPQTVNFHTPFVKDFVSRCFRESRNVTLMCRDEVSYAMAEELFPTTRLLLYPDIVTSLIGTRRYAARREGILFCMRDDVEAHYSADDISRLMERFGTVRKEKVDTTLKGVTWEHMDKHREEIISAMIEKFSTYKVVVTDRYHGTIFSAIASTPVVVISSADHKLSSGVRWFPEDVFHDAVQYAASLDEAYEKAERLLAQEGREYYNPPYFKQRYWDVLKGRLDE